LRGSCLRIDVSEIVVHEADEPTVGVDLAQTEALSSEDRGDEDVPAVQADGAVAGDDEDEVVEEDRRARAGRRSVAARRRSGWRGLHVGRLVRTDGVEVGGEGIESGRLGEAVGGCGRVVSCFRVICMRSWAPFCRGRPGVMRSMPMPGRNHQTGSFERP